MSVSNQRQKADVARQAGMILLRRESVVKRGGQKKPQKNRIETGTRG